MQLLSLGVRRLKLILAFKRYIRTVSQCRDNANRDQSSELRLTHHDQYSKQIIQAVLNPDMAVDGGSDSDAGTGDVANDRKIRDSCNACSSHKIRCTKGQQRFL